MADTSIFSIQPPEWMQHRAEVGYESALEDSKQLGQNLGMAAGSAIVAGINPKDSKQNFLSRWSSAYHEIEDPFYQGKKAQSDLQVATLKDRIQGMKEYPEWLKSTGGNAEKMLDAPFTGTSEWASSMVEQAKMQAWQRSTQRQAVEVRQQQVENQLEIAQLKNQIEADRIANAKQIAEITAQSRKDVAQTTATSRENVAETQAQNRIDVAQLNAQTQKELAKIHAQGKNLTLGNYISRGHTTVFNSLRGNYDPKKDADITTNGKFDEKKASQKAVKILAEDYDSFSAQEPATPEPASPVKVGGFTVTPVTDNQ